MADTRAGVVGTVAAALARWPEAALALPLALALVLWLFPRDGLVRGAAAAVAGGRHGGLFCYWFGCTGCKRQGGCGMESLRFPETVFRAGALDAYIRLALVPWPLNVAGFVPVASAFSLRFGLGCGWLLLCGWARGPRGSGAGTSRRWGGC